MRISIDNGNTFCEPEEALRQVGMETLVEYMDDEIREAVHRELAPCSEVEFLMRYLELADENLVVG